MVGVLLERVRRPAGGGAIRSLSVVVIFIGLLGHLQQRRRLDLDVFGQDVSNVRSSMTCFRSNKYITSHEIGSLLVMLIELARCSCFFRFTSLGLAMRAAAYNPISSRLVGVRVDLMLALGWGIAAAIGAVAGMMIAAMWCISIPT